MLTWQEEEKQIPSEQLSHSLCSLTYDAYKNFGF